MFNDMHSIAIMHADTNQCSRLHHVMLMIQKSFECCIHHLNYKAGGTNISVVRRHMATVLF